MRALVGGTIRIVFFWSCIRGAVTFAGQKVPHSNEVWGQHLPKHAVNEA